MVTVNGESPKLISYQDLDGARDPGPSPVPYQVRTIPGQPTQGEPHPDYVTSVRTVLRTLVGVDPDQIETVAVQAVGFGGVTVLDQTALSAPGSPGFPFADGLMPAFYGNGPDNPHAIGFIRPLRPSTSDTNAKDWLQTLNNGTMQLRVHTSGEVLHPVVTASTTKTQAGQPVSFTVTLDQPADSALHYAWDFGDGATSEQESPSHAWAQGGSSYQVIVTVTAESGASGPSAPVVIQVGKKPDPGDHPGAGSGDNDNPDAQQHGPRESSGSHDGAASDQDSAGQQGDPEGSDQQPGTPTRRRGQHQHHAAGGLVVEGVLLDPTSSGRVVSGVERPAAAQAAHSVPPVDHTTVLLGFGAVGCLLALGALGQVQAVRRRLPVPVWRRG